MKRESQINVNSNNDYLVWKIDTDNANFEKAKVVTLNVGIGCEAVCYVNGGSPRKFYPGTYHIDWKKETKKGNTISIIGINHDKSFKLKCGVGEIPFNDKPVKLAPLVGIRVDFECTLTNGEAIYTEFGEGVKGVTPNDVSVKLRTEFQKTLVSEFAKVLENYDYFTINQSIGALSEVVKNYYAKALLDGGIFLKSCSVSAPYFPEDYNEERQRKVDDVEAARRAEIQKSQDVGILRELNKSATSKKVRCPRCGKENEEGTKYCRACGKEIK